MQRTNQIYEVPSRLSQALVVGLSIAVVLMAGWFVATITLAPTATTSVEGAADAVAGALDGSSGLPTTLRQSKRSTSVHFDWPAQFESAPPPQPAPPPVQTALPLAPELPPARDMGRTPWPAAPDVRDRSLPSRLSAGAASEATDAIVDILAPPAPSRPAAAAPTRQAPSAAQRRQKPRVVETDAAAQ